MRWARFVLVVVAAGCGAHAARPPAMLTECRLRACTFHEAIVELRVLANQARDPVAERKPREQHAMELSFDPGALAGSATP